MEEQKKNPELRFEGFTEDWQEKKLKVIADIIGGGTPSTSIPEYWNGNIDWYSPSEIGNEVYANGSVNKITIEGYENSSAKMLPPNKTILFTSRAGIGDMAILQKEGCTNQGFQSLVLKNGYDPYFVYSAGHLIKKYALSKASGSTFLEISSRILGDMDLSIPESEDEQQQIGTFFKNIDELITKHQKKHNRLVTLKKSMLEKMFPKEGQTVPEIRFKGFEGEWDQNTIDEVARVYDGTHQTPKYTDSGVMFLSVENISDLKSEKYISNEAFEEEFKNYPQKGDLLMTRIGDVGTVNVVESDSRLAYYVSLALIKCNELDPYFLRECLTSEPVRSDIWKRTLHIAFPKKINKGEIEKVMIIHPKSVYEQKAIGSFFKNLRSLIESHRKQIAKLKNFKQSLSEKMFV